MSGQKPAVLGTIERSGKSVKILARKDAGVDKPEDLRGKKIAFYQVGAYLGFGGGPLIGGWIVLNMVWTGLFFLIFGVGGGVQ